MSGLGRQAEMEGNKRVENPPKRRKKYLGPNSTESMPRSSRYLYKQTQESRKAAETSSQCSSRENSEISPHLQRTSKEHERFLCVDTSAQNASDYQEAFSPALSSDKTSFGIGISHNLQSSASCNSQTITSSTQCENMNLEEITSKHAASDFISNDASGLPSPLFPLHVTVAYINRLEGVSSGRSCTSGNIPDANADSCGALRAQRPYPGGDSSPSSSSSDSQPSSRSGSSASSSLASDISDEDIDVPSEVDNHSDDEQALDDVVVQADGAETEDQRQLSPEGENNPLCGENEGVPEAPRDDPPADDNDPPARDPPADDNDPPARDPPADDNDPPAGDLPADDNDPPARDHPDDDNGPPAGDPIEDGQEPGAGNPRDYYHQVISHQRLRQKSQGEYGANIDTEVIVSSNDALYMALGLARRDNFTNTALTHAVDLINALFADDVLPSTSYLLDALLVCNVGVNYYFYCSQCSHCFGQLDYKNIKHHVCEKCNTQNNISDLRIATFFVIFDLPLQLQALLNIDYIRNALSSPAELVARSRDGYLSDICDGSVYKAFAAAVANLNERVLSFQFGIDGSPLAVSSNCSIWPILIACNELPITMRMSNLLLGGLWFGVKQARTDLFLMPFVNHMRQLSQGFEMQISNEVWLTRAYVLGCCADSGARGKVQGVKAHSGYFSCNWCCVSGEWIGGAVRFPLRPERPPIRTHEQLVRLQERLVANPILRGIDIEDTSDNEEGEEGDEYQGDYEAERQNLGVNAVSPLINMPTLNMVQGSPPSFDMVNSFFVDTMHCLDLGISKAFLSKWMEDFGYEYYIKDSIEEINKRIKLLRPPVECRRMPREMSERARFKSRENHNWMMYYCVPVLSGILPHKYLKVWLLLIQALYLLSRTEVSYDHINVADTLITQFLVETQELYDESDMSFNLHILKHLVAHVLRFGPFVCSSAYCYEDGNRLLKQIIHSNLGIPHQVIRALSWKQSMAILEPLVSQKARDYVTKISTPKQHKQRSVRVGTSRLIGKPKRLHLLDEEKYLIESNDHLAHNLVRYGEVVYNNCLFADNSCPSSKTDNSIAQLTDKKIVLIRKILLDRVKNEVVLVVSDVNFQTVFVPPRDVHLDGNDHFLRKVTDIDEELRYIKCTDLKIICFRTKYTHGDYVAPFPNVYNRQ